MTQYQKYFLGTLVFFILFLFVSSSLINNQIESEKMFLESQKIQVAKKENEIEINSIQNPKINVSSVIKSTGDYIFTMFTNLPNETLVEGNIIFVKNDANEIVDTFKGTIKNKKLVLEGNIDPTIFKKDNIANLKFVGTTRIDDLYGTYSTKTYDYTKYFLPPEPVGEVAEVKNEYNEKYEAIQNEPVKTFNIPSAYLLTEELSSTFGYYIENSNIDGLKITTLSGNNSSIMITGFDVSRVYISGTFPVNSLDYGTILDIIFADVDLDIWVMAQIDNSKNGRNPLKKSYIKDDLNVEFESNKVGFSITAKPR